MALKSSSLITTTKDAPENQIASLFRFDVMSDSWRERLMPQKANNIAITALARPCTYGGRSRHDLGQLSAEFGDAQLIE